MPCHILFEITTFPLSNGIINYMIASEIIKGHGGIFLRNFFLRLDISYIYIWIVLEVLYTNIYAINYFHCVFLCRGDIEHWSILGHF